MADSRFFDVAGPFSIEELAGIAKAEVAGAISADARFKDVQPLDAAGPEDVSFLDNPKYTESFTKSRAGLCIVHPKVADQAPEGMALLVTPEPYHAYARVARVFYPVVVGNEGISPAAHVGEGAKLGADVVIEPGAVIGKGAEIGDRTRISANAVIGNGVVIGQDGYIGPSATVVCALVGDRAIIHTGVRIGQDGFGFAMGPGGHLKVPQLGRVRIGNDVEIGANTTIDRGTGPDTVIGDGCKIDNLVQIGHNVVLGRCCVVVAQVGLSGSTNCGDFVVMGGQAGLAGHLSIGSGAKIAAKSGVFRDIPAGQEVAGYPAMPRKEHWRQVAALARLARKKGE